MATTKVEQIVAIYTRELACFRRTLALAEEQAKCLGMSNFAVLNEILERRQSLASEISDLSAEALIIAQELAADLGLPAANLTNLRQRLPDSVVAPLERVLAQIREVAEQIQDIDNKCELEVRQTMQGLQGEMSTVQRGQTAMRAYKNAPQSNAARFIDRQK